jgi:hypothetical protein
MLGLGEKVSFKKKWPLSPYPFLKKIILQEDILSGIT